MPSIEGLQRHLLVKRRCLEVLLVEIRGQEGEVILQPFVVVGSGKPVTWIPPTTDWSE